MTQYDIIVQNQQSTIHASSSIKFADMAAVWHRVNELAIRYDTPGTRIKVIDGSGNVVISVGVMTAQKMLQGKAA